jgi:uncharacterized membrane protein YdbT with pleckstrin-like domain
VTLNRAEALAGVVISLALAILPVVGNFDWTSTAGVLAGIVAVLGIVNQRLRGWQMHEANLFYASQDVEQDPPEPPPLNVPPATPPGEPA